MYNKFIITQTGEIRFGCVYLHRELLPKGHSTCHGGGLWKVDKQRGIIMLYGRSFDFGLPDFDYAKYVDDTQPPANLGYPIFYMRMWGNEEVLEPVEPLRKLTGNMPV